MPWPRGGGGGSEEGGDRLPPPNRHKNHSMKKAKSIEKLGGGYTLHDGQAKLCLLIAICPADFRFTSLENMYKLFVNNILLNYPEID